MNNTTRIASTLNLYVYSNHMKHKKGFVAEAW